MNKWTNEWINEWMNEWNNGWIMIEKEFTCVHIQAKLGQENLLRMVRWIRWHWTRWYGQVRYLSVTDAACYTEWSRVIWEETWTPRVWIEPRNIYTMKSISSYVMLWLSFRPAFDKLAQRWANLSNAGPKLIEMWFYQRRHQECSLLLWA